jgi:hypothetical protein
MRTTLMLAALAALTITGQAEANTWRCGQHVVATGDSVSTLRQKCGEPDRVVQLVNVYGAGSGQRWEYDRRGVTTLVTLSAGRIDGIAEVR